MSRQVRPNSRADRILAALREHPGGLTAPQLAPITDPEFNGATKPAGIVGIELHKMEHRGLVHRKGTCRYPVTWQAVPGPKVARRRPGARWEGMIMRDPRTPQPPAGSRRAEYADHPSPCAHRLLAAIEAEMPPVQPGALTEAELDRWVNLMAAVLEAVYGAI